MCVCVCFNLFSTLSFLYLYRLSRPCMLYRNTLFLKTFITTCWIVKTYISSTEANDFNKIKCSYLCTCFSFQSIIHIFTNRLTWYKRCVVSTTHFVNLLRISVVGEHCLLKLWEHDLINYTVVQVWCLTDRLHFSLTVKLNLSVRHCEDYLAHLEKDHPYRWVKAERFKCNCITKQIKPSRIHHSNCMHYS